MMMRKAEGDEELTGNNRFEGYCKDMMDLIAKRLGINCNDLFLKAAHLKIKLIQCCRLCRRVARS